MGTHDMGTGKNKIVSLADAIGLIDNHEEVFVSGFGSNGVPDYLLHGLAVRFEQTHSPRDLSILFGGGPGDGGDKGLNRIAKKGLVARAVGGHWGLVPRLGEMAIAGDIQAWNFPLGVISHLLRDLARGQPGTLTSTGLDTFADPRQEGCRIGAHTVEERVGLVQIAGREMLFYSAPVPKVALLRGSTADRAGNITLERETLTQDVLAAATAVHNGGGLVIVQVERLAESGSLDPRRVKIPGLLVDCVVVAPPEYHPQTFGTAYSPAFSAEIRAPLDGLAPIPLNERKIIARRAALELVANGVVNLGIGMPEGVAAVASEERVLDFLTLTAEPGLIGGMPQSGLDFGAAINPDAVIDMNQQFDLYDGGGLDLAFLGLAQVDSKGNVNVSRFGPKLAGAGGFINITQNARALVYMGTFTAGGLAVSICDGLMSIDQEGKARKFLREIEQITFSGERAAAQEQPVLFVTERCVFRLTRDGLALTEYAPGVDIERDIVAHMDFQPFMDDPLPMDGIIFRPDPMNLHQRLFRRPIEDRISFSPERNAIFVDLEGLHVSRRETINDVSGHVRRIARNLGRKVPAVVNYDNFTIEEALLDHWAEMVSQLEAEVYSEVTRFTTSAFLRARLGEKLTQRGLQPHIFDKAVQGRETGT